MSIRMRKRALPVVLAGWALPAAILPNAAQARVTLGNWDAAQQRQVVRAGLMSNLRGNDFGGAAEISVQIIKQSGKKPRARVRARDLHSGDWLMVRGYDAGGRWDVLYGAMNNALNIAIKAAGWQFA